MAFLFPKRGRPKATEQTRRNFPGIKERIALVPRSLAWPRFRSTKESSTRARDAVYTNVLTLGPNDLKIGHLGQVCTLYTFSYQTLHTALVRCLDHFQSKKNVKISYCDVITDDVTKTWYTNFLISNHQIHHLKEHD